MFIRKSVFELVGGFDERFFMYCEESDLCMSVRSRGFTNTIIASPASLHIGGVSAASVPSATLSQWAYSRILFSRKHFSIGGSFCVLVTITLIEPLARVLRKPNELPTVWRAWSRLYSMLHRKQ